MSTPLDDDDNNDDDDDDNDDAGSDGGGGDDDDVMWCDVMMVMAHKVCMDRLPDVPCNVTRQMAYANGTCYRDTGGLVGIWNQTVFENVTRLKRTSASEEYYK